MVDLARNDEGFSGKDANFSGKSEMSTNCSEKNSDSSLNSRDFQDFGNFQGSTPLQEAEGGRDFGCFQDLNHFQGAKGRLGSEHFQNSKYLLGLKKRVDECWEFSEANKNNQKSGLKERCIPEIVTEIMEGLDCGKIRVVDRVADRDRSEIAKKSGTNEYVVNEYIKKAILLYFRFSEASFMDFGGTNCFDKVPLKTADWTAVDFGKAGFRAAPGAIIRYSAYIAPKVVAMQSFVNVGAFVDEGSMLDTYSLVGSCVQVGKKCHISAGVILGGVLEPLQANPVIIEDNCFIGACSSVTEGVIVGRGAVVASGVHLTASTKIIDKVSGEISYGRIPEYAVVVPGVYSSDGGVNLGCAVIIKKCDAFTREKVSINELLRD